MPIRPWHVKRALIYFCFLLLLLPPASRGLGETREPGDCGCAPSLYTFRLNLSLDCDDTKIQNTEHVDSSRCVISHNVDKPKSVHSILVEETSFKGAETVSEEGSGFFENGSTFSFRSNLLPPNDVAKELRMVLIGFDESGTTLITNEISIEFANICRSTPVFQQGDSIGWIEILSSTNGPEYCIPTPLPSMGPTRRGGESAKCVCSPTRYALELDLDLTCDNSYERSPSTGIEGTFCFVASQTSEKPLEITDVTMIEVDENFEVINQQIQQGRFGSGDVLEFETITLRNNSLSILPRAIQFSLSGINLEGDLIDQTWIMQFTNDCDVNPVLTGVEIGWTRIVRTSPPNEVYCQAAATKPLSEGSSPTLTRSHSSQPSNSKCVKSGKDRSTKSMSPSSIRPEKSGRRRHRRRAVEEDNANSNRLLVRDGIIAPRTSLVVPKRGKGGGKGSEQPATCY